MKKRYIIALAMMLVLSSSIVMGTTVSYQSDDFTTETRSDLEQASRLQTTSNITISFSKAPLFSGVNIEIKNNGVDTLNNISWSFRAKPQISGTGLIYKDQIRSGVIDQLDADERVTIPLRPFKIQTRSPFGLGLF